MAIMTKNNTASPWPSKRLSSDAGIVLRNAGYVSKHGDYNNGKPQVLIIESKRGGELERLPIIGGCVNNADVERLLKEARA